MKRLRQEILLYPFTLQKKGYMQCSIKIKKDDYYKSIKIKFGKKQILKAAYF